MVNSIMYSLRNKDIKKAVRGLMSQWAYAKGRPFSQSSLGFCEGGQTLG